MTLTAFQVSYIREAANDEGLNEDFCLAIIDKESAGQTLYDVGRGTQYPAIRFEGHIFYKRLSGKERQRAVTEGLASPKAGAVKNPGTMAGRYALLERAAKINFAAAYESISIGIGQVMGFNYRSGGYPSAWAMLEAAKSFEGQVNQMLAFIHDNPKLVKAVNNRAFKDFALIYNGPKAKASYWVELEQFYIKWTHNLGPNAVQVSRVDEKRIYALGFKTVRDFQQARSIAADGVIGKITREQIAAAEAEQEKREKAPLEAAGKLGGVGAVVGAAVVVNDNQDVLTGAVQSVMPVMEFLKSMVPFGAQTVAACAGAIMGYAAYKAYKHWKQ